MTFKITRALIRLFFRLIARIEVQGMENVPRSGGLVAVTNHVGRIDPGLAYVLIDRDDIIMLVAEKYRETAIFRWLTWAIDGIWVDRFNADFSAVRACLRRLKRGGMMVIAPEGTRSPTGSLIRAQSGAGYLAMKSGAPILPSAVTGTEDAEGEAPPPPAPADRYPRAVRGAVPSCATGRRRPGSRARRLRRRDHVPDRGSAASRPARSVLGPPQT